MLLKVRRWHDAPTTNTKSHHFWWLFCVECVSIGHEPAKSWFDHKRKAHGSVPVGKTDERRGDEILLIS